MGLLLPVKVETWEEHFVDNSWDTPQDQIDAGYPIFIQPTALTAEFEQTYDLGAVLNSSNLVSLAVAKSDVVAGVDIIPTISLSDDNSTWVDHADVYSIYASDFRYIKISLAVTGDGLAIARISDIKITVSVKELRDAGGGNALAADSGGTTVNFNKDFVDIDSITVTAEHQAGETKGITAVYDFTDTPNPTSFKVLLFSNNSGNRIDGAFKWAAKGA